MALIQYYRDNCMRSLLRATLVIVLISSCHSSLAIADEYVSWKNDSLAIEKALGGLKGNPQRGRAIVIAPDKGSCLTCHHMPIDEEPFHGTVGPDLSAVASRLTEGEIRLRIVDEKVINPNTIMPGYYRDPNKFNQVAEAYYGKTFLTPQEVEDVIAYLMTLK